MNSEFGKWRSIFWPIHKFELKQFIPMFVMFFFVNLNYSLLRIMKDTLVVNAPGGGAELLPLLKTFCTTPAAIIFMILYVAMSTRLSVQKLFYATIAPFIGFFILFPLVLMPNLELLRPDASSEWLLAHLPSQLSSFVGIWRNWVFAFFYTFSELWGSVILSTLYWGLANNITKVSQSKRFYGLLGIGANFALLFVNPIAKYTKTLGSWSSTINFVMAISVLSGFAICLIYYYIDKNIGVVPEKEVGTKKKKIKLGFIDSIKELSKSKYCALLAIMVLGYGISINLVEVTWKHYVKVLMQGSQQGFFEFQAMTMSVTAVFTIVLLYLGTGNVIRKFGWRTAALITPIVLLITSSLFFANISIGYMFAGIISTLGYSPLMIIAYAGAIQNSLSKSCKYSFFDPTKEMAYIPLDPQTKTTSKAAIDGVGGRLGKSGGAVINMILLMALGSIEAASTYIGFITIGIISLWILAAFKLNKLYVKLGSEKKEDLKIKPEPEIEKKLKSELKNPFEAELI